VQGSGSGIDVWASVHGGLRVWPTRESRDPVPLTAVYSGNSAKTGPRVQVYRAWTDREAFATDSAALLELPLHEALKEGWRLLCDMAGRAGLDYATPALRRIVQLAEDHGGAAKPSGAGGGDVAVALIEDPDARAQFERACALEGFPPIPVQICGGARVGAHLVAKG
jgi:mevalonate kinase